MGNPRCSHRIRGGWRPQICSRDATVTVDGKHYCTQHSPAKADERRDAYLAKMDHKRAQVEYRIAYQAWQADCVKLVERIATTGLRGIDEVLGGAVTELVRRKPQQPE